MLCIRKSETASYLQYIYDLNCVYPKEGTASYLQYVYDLAFAYHKNGNDIIPTICLWSRFYVSERRKWYHTYNMFMV